MTRKAHAHRKPPAAPQTRRRWAPWAVLGGVVVALLVASIGPDRALGALTRLAPGGAREPLSLTILHTNDTWGFFLPCG